MLSHFATVALTLFCLATQLQAESEKMTIIAFTPPKGWRFADKKLLPPSVEAMVVGTGKRDFPPSINLSTESYDGTIAEYLDTVRSINRSHGNDWKDLGSIQTGAGPASLSQVITNTEWGNVQMMHVILVDNGRAFILTAASLQSEFPRFYKEFFPALSSLHFEP